MAVRTLAIITYSLLHKSVERPSRKFHINFARVVDAGSELYATYRPGGLVAG